MNTKRILDRHDVLDNQLHMYSNQVSNCKSVSHVHSERKELSLDEIECYLRKYFSNNMSIIRQYFQMTDFIDKQTFEEILRNSGLSINDTLWNSFQSTDKGISYQMFLQRFAPLEIEKNPNSTIFSSNQCRILNYVSRICHIIKNYWQNLKDEFSSLDRSGRLFITIDQAIVLMRKYCFPLNDQQQCELALLFSPKKNGQFNYFDFMEYFTNQSGLKDVNQNVYSRLTYAIQTKQSWTLLPITIDSILNRIRSQCVCHYENIYRMFRITDKNHRGYLTNIQFKQLLKQLDIQLNQEEFYHIISEIDKNQDGLISYDELYYSLITDALQI